MDAPNTLALAFIGNALTGYTLADMGPTLTCGETDSLATGLALAGWPDSAETLILNHADGDDEGDGHLALQGDASAVATYLSSILSAIDACKEGRHRPDDMPEPGDRCKDCGFAITWVGPGNVWTLADN